MSELIVIAYEDEANAEAAYTKVQELQRDLVVQLQGVALVTVDEDGKTHVTSPNASVGQGTATGAMFGMLIGILFLIPFFGLVMGGLMGALFAGMNKTGVNAEFRSQVKAAVKDGKSAVVIYASKITEDKFGAAMAEFGGEVIKTSLSDEDEKALAHDLAGA